MVRDNVFYDIRAIPTTLECHHTHSSSTTIPKIGTRNREYEDDVSIASNHRKRRLHFVSVTQFCLFWQPQCLHSLLLQYAGHLTSSRRLRRVTARYQTYVWYRLSLHLQRNSEMTIMYQIPMAEKQLCPCSSETTKAYISLTSFAKKWSTI